MFGTSPDRRVQDSSGSKLTTQGSAFLTSVSSLLPRWIGAGKVMGVGLILGTVGTSYTLGQSRWQACWSKGLPELGNYGRTSTVVR